MEKINEFIKSPKKTVLLGLVGTGIMLLLNLVSMFSLGAFSIGYLIRYVLLDNLFTIAFFVYFAIMAAKLFLKKGNVKTANNLLIIFLIINTILGVFSTVTSMLLGNFYYRYGILGKIFDIIISLPLNIFYIVYIVNILVRKNTKINNKIFAIIFAVPILLNLFSTLKYGFLNIIYYIGKLAILPYFYGYYEILKGELEMANKEEIEDLGMGTTINNNINRTTGRVSDKDWLTTLLLCFFCGGLGIHDFYVGRTTEGILHIITFGGFGIWTLIDLINIVTGKFTDEYGNLITNGSKSNKQQYSEMGSADEIKKYKDLLDAGAITQEEFDAKKRQLLGL